MSFWDPPSQVALLEEPAKPWEPLAPVTVQGSNGLSGRRPVTISNLTRGTWRRVYTVNDESADAWDAPYTAVLDARTGDRLQVLRFDVVTGDFVDILVPATNTQVNVPKDLVFGPDGSFFIASAQSDEIIRYGQAFTVSLSETSEAAITVDFDTADLVPAEAVAGDDYTAISGTLTFAPGETQRQILVSTIDDLEVEPNEDFTVVLSNLTGDATRGAMTGVVTIVDADALRAISIDDVTRS